MPNYLCHCYDVDYQCHPLAKLIWKVLNNQRTTCSLVDWYYKAYLLIEQTNQQYWSCYRGLLDNFCVIKRTTLLDHQVGNACPFDSIWVF
jgi:hypothetical protein